jgi:hypothetical protein
MSCLCMHIKHKTTVTSGKVNHDGRLKSVYFKRVICYASPGKETLAYYTARQQLLAQSVCVVRESEL